MTFSSRVIEVVSAIGADIKAIQLRLTSVETYSPPLISKINDAARLIQTQRITAQIVLRGQIL